MWFIRAQLNSPKKAKQIQKDKYSLSMLYSPGEGKVTESTFNLNTFPTQEHM